MHEVADGDLEIDSNSEEGDTGDKVNRVGGGPRGPVTMRIIFEVVGDIMTTTLGLVNRRGGA